MLGVVGELNPVTVEVRVLDRATLPSVAVALTYLGRTRVLLVRLRYRKQGSPRPVTLQQCLPLLPKKENYPLDKALQRWDTLPLEVTRPSIRPSILETVVLTQLSLGQGPAEHVFTRVLPWK